MIDEINCIVCNLLKQLCSKKIEDDPNQTGHKIDIETILNTLK